VTNPSSLPPGTQAPVCISPNRQQAIECLLQHAKCDVIISDDGLQHYKLQRDFELVIMDAERGLGNGFLLPSGPLRELPSRLKNVDIIITNGSENQYSDAVMTLKPQYAVNLVTKAQRPLNEFSQATAIAGIGNPPRFFTMLQQHGIQLMETQAFQDHQTFSPELFAKFDKNRPLFNDRKRRRKMYDICRRTLVVCAGNDRNPRRKSTTIYSKDRTKVRSKNVKYFQRWLP